MTPELQVANELRAQLRQHGAVQLQYLTAEFQPFSNQQRPDIVFSPSSGPYSDCLVFIELKLGSAASIHSRLVSTLMEHRTFASEALERPIAKYLFACSAPIPEHLNRSLLKSGISSIELVTSSADVIHGLRGLHILS